jgi:hypothetical protein
MDRRSAIRALATAGAVPLLAPDQLSALLTARRIATPLAPGGFAPQALSVREFEVVAAVADLIFPRTETPSATDLGVPAFVDLLADEWMDAAELASLRDGLASLDADARARFGSGFVETTAAERVTLLRELDDELPETPPLADVPSGFYPTLKRFIVVGYFTSEEGSGQTGYRIVPGAFGGCFSPGVGR